MAVKMRVRAPKVRMQVTSPAVSMRVEPAKLVYIGGDPYDGEYEVTPQITEQTLPTAGKLMAQDVTVREIPRYDVSNTSGGTTIFIANEV